MKEAIHTFAPSMQEASAFAECFFSRAGWLGSPCTKERFYLDLLNPLYSGKSWEGERAEAIALFFGILAVGCVFDPNRQHYDPLAFRLNKLCAASLALAKPIDHPTMMCLEALVGVEQYLLSSTDPKPDSKLICSSFNSRIRQWQSLECGTYVVSPLGWCKQ